VVAHAVEALAAIVGRQRCWTGKGLVLGGCHWGRHVVRRREVLLWKWAGAGGLVARVVVVVGVGLILVLLLYNKISLGLQSPIPKRGKKKGRDSLPSCVIWSVN
jgi:hypothetical protein